MFANRAGVVATGFDVFETFLDEALDFVFVEVGEGVLSLVEAEGFADDFAGGGVLAGLDAILDVFLKFGGQGDVHRVILCQELLFIDKK